MNEMYIQPGNGSMYVRIDKNEIDENIEIHNRKEEEENLLQKEDKYNYNNNANRKELINVSNMTNNNNNNNINNINNVDRNIRNENISQREEEENIEDNIINIPTTVRENEYVDTVIEDLNTNQHVPPLNPPVGNRRIYSSWTLFYEQLVFLFVVLSCLIALIAAYHNKWDVACDYNLKIWSMVWICRCILQAANNLVLTRAKIMRVRPNFFFVFFFRFFHFFGFAWCLFGINVIFVEKRCDKSTIAYIVSQIMFWLTTLLYAIPFIFYLLFCLCLPCIIYFFVRFAVPPADRLPTPHSIIDQLEVKTYKELIEALNRQYNVAESEIILGGGISSLSLGDVIDNVSSLLGSVVTAPSNINPSPPSIMSSSNIQHDIFNRQLPIHSADTGSVSKSGTSGFYTCVSSNNLGESSEINDLAENNLLRSVHFFDYTSHTRSEHNLLQRQTITINKTCPICMVDINLEDEVMVMPCDNRHFFHKTCVTHWLETSQVCPICRDNIVHRLTGTTEIPKEDEQV